MTSQGHPFGVVGIDRPRQTTRHLSTPNETTWEGDMSLLPLESFGTSVGRTAFSVTPLGPLERVPRRGGAKAPS